MGTRAPLAFISYRRADSSAASRWLAQTLANTFGRRSVFIDTESIRMADAWPDRIDDALGAATLLIPVIGRAWLRIADDYGRRRLDKDDDWVRSEIRHALEARVPILPLLLSATPMPPRDALPPGIADLTRIQGFELRDDRWEADLSLVLMRMVDLGFQRVSTEPVRYPRPKLQIKELTETELAAALESLPHWKLVTSEDPGAEPRARTELHRSFEFASFEDAMAFVQAAVPKVSEMKHHPRWENVWRTVSVRLTTWDIGHKPSQLDADLARYLDELRGSFPGPKARA